MGTTVSTINGIAAKSACEQTGKCKSDHISKLTVIARLNIILSAIASFGMTIVLLRIADILRMLLQGTIMDMLTRFTNVAGNTGFPGDDVV